MEEKVHCNGNVKTSCVSHCQSEASVGFIENTIIAAYMLLVAIVPINKQGYNYYRLDSENTSFYNMFSFFFSFTG